MDTIVVYSAENSNRLKYVLDWVLKERLQLDYSITTNKQDTEGLKFFISYGASLPNSISIPAAGMLSQKDIAKLVPQKGNWKDLPTMFAVADKEYTLPFDLFTAVFYLLSRYEEYHSFNGDKHGRYPATNSILYKNGWLSRPIVDEWVWAFKKQMQVAMGMALPATHYLFQPTYDIDMAYSHLHKGFGRIIGAYMRALLKGDVKQISERTQVLKKKQKDPYDSFRWLRQLHKEYDCKPLYFILSSAQTTAFDKNIHPRHPAMVRVIKNVAKDGVVGIHPSYYSGEHNKIGKEKQMLEEVITRDIYISRQHYIRIKMPDTYRILLQNGITEDYSMGYGAYLGFRAGTGNSFYWYDLDQDSVTKLRIHPFCFMDTTAHFEAKLSAMEAFEKLHAMSRILEKTGSTMITIFHNFSLGTSHEWKGWRQAYEDFVIEKAAMHAKYD